MSSNPSPSDLEALLDQPALLPPNGTVPNFDNPPKSNTAGYILISIYVALATFAVLLRAYARICCARKVRLEDYLGLIGYSCYIGFIWAVYTVLEYPGFFVHQWDVRVRDMSRILYPFHISSNGYSDAIGFLKVAILLEWLRTFNPLGIRNAFFWTCHVVLWINILYYVASAIAINLSCIPRQKIWDKTIPDGTCLDSIALYLSGTIINLISDLAIFFTPQRIIWNLKMSSSKRLGVSFIFAIGILCCIIATFRVATTVQLRHQPDTIYSLASQAFWAGAEILLVLLVFCVPAFPQALNGLRAAGLLGPQKNRSQNSQQNLWDNSGSSWPRTKASTRQTNEYQEINEYGLEPLTNPGPPRPAGRSQCTNG